MNGHPNADAIAEIREMIEESELRLVTIVAAEDADGMMELIYVLDRGGELRTVRSRSRMDEELESLSPVLLGAENMEREIIDLLGARFEGVRGGLFLMPGSMKAPLRRVPAGGE
jgi:NADH:ubiquinone oxidoreductase subunit C